MSSKIKKKVPAVKRINDYYLEVGYSVEYMNEYDDILESIMKRENDSSGCALLDGTRDISWRFKDKAALTRAHNLIHKSIEKMGLDISYINTIASEETSEKITRKKKKKK